jgi:hypothetical protein
MVYPRECPGCGTLTPEDGFAVDRHQSSGRKSRCRACHRRDAKAYHATIRKPRRLAALEAERAAEMRVLEREHKRRLKAVHKEAAEGARRQKKLLRELGILDLSAEEITERVRRRAQGGRPPESGPNPSDGGR